LVNHLVQLVGIAAACLVVLVLGMRFLTLYGSRTSTGLDRSEPASDRAALRLTEADAEAEAVRTRAHREAEASRRAADIEIDALRRAAQTEADNARANAEAAKARAQAIAADLIADAERAAEREARTVRAALSAEAAELQARADQLELRTAELQAAEQALQQQLAAAENAAQQALASQAEHDQARQQLEQARSELDQQRLTVLEQLAELTPEQARTELLATVEATARRDALSLVRTIESEARAEATERARTIVVEAVQRVASEQTAETVVSVLHLPGEEMKGRIIGREGRNIRAFESVTGVNVIIDDTPEAVLLSCFDPVRREVGRITLEKLILDGRIHPHRIEEIYESAKVEVDERCLRAASDALADVGIADLDERLIPTLGRLKYRTSYGQNVLGHLLETAHIAGVMASELGLEPSLIKRSAFLHDIGKALTHEVEGSHAIIGAELLRRFGESEAVAHAVEAHHNEVAPRTVEAVLTQAADACSAARPGARRESLESYVKRLERIESIASARPGVERVFAMQSGREVRVMVLPDEVDDLAAGVIAREVAKQIEDELTYPGQIRVTVVRESRATEVAH
jgi:ribonuclease Y